MANSIGDEEDEGREELETRHLEFSERNPNLDGDRSNFCLLIVLYVIQGFVIGFSTALPVILQSRKIVTYEDQALFSVVVWPHSLKLLWAPLVDAVYVRRIGRRKCWLIPIQLLMVTFWLCMANNIEHWLLKSGRPNFKMIILVIFIMNFLSATHDIVVDGWSLTMLKKRNVKYASTCNSVGAPIGMFIGSVCFTLLVSERSNDKFAQREPGISGGLITMKTFLNCWAVVVFSVAFSVAIFKQETRDMKHDYKKVGVAKNYKLIWNILKLPGTKVLATALMTTMIGFTATESVSHLKLIDAGVPKDGIMFVYTLMYAVKFVMPVFVSKYITGPNPMSYYLKTTPFRLVWGIVMAVFVYFTPSMIRNSAGDVNNVPVYYYLTLGLVYTVNESMSFFMLLTLFAFFCQISDPRFGGTYMTLFSTFFFIGWIIPNTLVLKLVDGLTFFRCSTDAQNACTARHLKEVCKSTGGSCVTRVDGYYVAMVICIVFGLVWYRVFRNVIDKYQSLGLFAYVEHCRPLSTVAHPEEEDDRSCVATSSPT